MDRNSNGQKILIIEDDAQNNQMLREYLESHGYMCRQAYSGSEGKLLFSMEEFDLILLDLMLPGITGEELVSVRIISASRLTCRNCWSESRCSCAAKTEQAAGRLSTRRMAMSGGSGAWTQIHRK